ncbi:MAG: hypothetical protein ACTSRC_07880 [Candidatus Helarchaeota archaeon]
MSEEGRFLSDEKLKEKGRAFLKKITMNYEYFSKLSEEKTDKIKPIKKGDIPKMAVLLGLLDPFFYDLYTMCNGERDVGKLSKILGLEPKAVRVLMDALAKNGLIEKLEK